MGVYGQLVDFCALANLHVVLEIHGCTMPCSTSKKSHQLCHWGLLTAGCTGKEQREVRAPSASPARSSAGASLRRHATWRQPTPSTTTSTPSPAFSTLPCHPHVERAGGQEAGEGGPLTALGRLAFQQRAGLLRLVRPVSLFPHLRSRTPFERPATAARGRRREVGVQGAGGAGRSGEDPRHQSEAAGSECCHGGDEVTGGPCARRGGQQVAKWEARVRFATASLPCLASRKIARKPKHDETPSRVFPWICFVKYVCQICLFRQTHLRFELFDDQLHLLYRSPQGKGGVLGAEVVEAQDKGGVFAPSSSDPPAAAPAAAAPAAAEPWPARASSSCRCSSGMAFR